MTTRPTLGAMPTAARPAGRTPMSDADFAAGLARLEAMEAAAQPATPPPRPRKAAGRPPAVRRHRHQAQRFVNEREHSTPLDRNLCAKLLALAEHLERSTKQKGHKNGALGRSGVDIFRALICKFANAATGICCPSYLAIQRITGYCEQAIADALHRLEQTKLLTITRRLVVQRLSRISPITGLPETIMQTMQGTNLYAFHLPASGRIPLPAWPTRTARRRPQPDSATHRENNITHTKGAKTIGQQLVQELLRLPQQDSFQALIPFADPVR